MSNPLVSVVIPAYNAAKTISTTVGTVLDQSVQDFEIVIVDDGSTDNTVDVAGSIGDPRLRVVLQANGGASSARNAGIREARGEYVAFLDADDLWLPNKLEKQLSVLENGSGSLAVQNGAYYVDGDLQFILEKRCLVPVDPVMETLLFQNVPAVMSTLMVRRSVFETIGYLDTSLVILEDWDLMIKLSRYCNLQSIPDPLTLYRVYPGNRSKDLSIHIEPGHLVLNRLFADPTVPEYIKKQRRKIFAAFYRMLSGGAVNIGKYGEAVKWGAKSVAEYPPSITEFTSVLGRRVRRKKSRSEVPKELAEFVKRVKEKEAGE